MAERDLDRSVSQTVRAQLTLRDLILSGGLRPGERISELQAVETTGASRTPVRMALCLATRTLSRALMVRKSCTF